MRVTKQKQLIGLLLGLSIMSTSYAYYCSSPKGNGYVNTGDTMQEVQNVCGAPDQVTSQAMGGPKVQQVQYWTYTHQPIEARFNAAPPPSQTNIPPNVTFTIIDNKVASISVQNKQLTSSNLCRTGMQVQVGQEAQSVLTSCGRPDFTDTEQQNITTPLQTTITWTYNVPNNNPIVLTFTNGQLNEIMQ